MNLFSWLVIGHLVGDWVLQNHWMASRKQRGLLEPALWVHCAIYTITVVAAYITTVWFGTGGVKPATVAGSGIMLGFALVVFASHFLIDGKDLAGMWGHLILQSDLKLVRIMVDQSFHVILLAIAAEILSA